MSRDNDAGGRVVEWDRSDPLEDAIYRLCEVLVGEDWTICDDGDFGVPRPSEAFPGAVRRFMGPLLDRDELLKLRLESLETEARRIRRLLTPDSESSPQKSTPDRTKPAEG